MTAKNMLNSPTKHLTELAKSGHTESLNILLGYFMQSIETTARSIIKDGFVELVLEGYTSTPNQKQSEKYLYKFFAYLQIPTIQEVKFFAKDYETQRLAWWSTIKIGSLSSPPNSSSHGNSEFLRKSTEEEAIDHKIAPLTDFLLVDQCQPPQPVAFEDLPKDLQGNIRRAGLRPGEGRPVQEAEQIYEMIPENVRRGGSDAVEAYKKQHDWSHKKPHAQGGSNHPSNGDWENSSVNRSRGAKEMTKAEANNIAKAKAQINFQEGTKIIAFQALEAGIIAGGVEVAFSGLDNFLAVQRGEKTVEKALVDTLASSVSAAVVTATMVGGISALVLVFPPAGVALATAAPVLKIVGGVAAISRLVEILSNSGKVQGIDKIEALLLSYGIDDVELDFRDLELEDDLLKLKLSMQLGNL